MKLSKTVAESTKNLSLIYNYSYQILPKLFYYPTPNTNALYLLSTNYIKFAFSAKFLDIIVVYAPVSTKISISVWLILPFINNISVGTKSSG